MSQIINVFRKDCHCFWPEIFATLILSGLIVWVYPLRWTTHDPSAEVVRSGWRDARHMMILANVVMGLLPTSWLLLISRVVHDENLVGHRQFWLTRPYDWRCLLASKLLFVVTFINLPLIAAQIGMLAREGFNPLEFVPGLLFCALMLFLVCVLPIFAFASVLSSLLRMILVLLALAALIGIAAFFAGSNDSPSVQVPWDIDLLMMTLLLVMSGTVLIVQYSSRRAWLSRTLLISLIVIVVLLSADPFDVQRLGTAYPKLPAGASPHLRVALQQAAGGDQLEGTGVPGKNLSIELHTRFFGLPNGYAIAVDNVRATMKTADGTRWSAPWRAVYNQRATASAPDLKLPLTFDGDIPEAMRSQPIRYEVEMAITELRPVHAESYAIPSTGKVSVPKFGDCAIEIGQPHYTPVWDCRMPMREPNLTLVKVSPQASPCSDASVSQSSIPSTSWIGSLSGDPAGVSLVSVFDRDISFSHPHGDPDDAYICPATNLRFTEFHLVKRFRFEFTFLTSPMDVHPVHPSKEKP